MMRVESGAEGLEEYLNEAFGSGRRTEFESVCRVTFLGFSLQPQFDEPRLLSGFCRQFAIMPGMLPGIFS